MEYGICCTPGQIQPKVVRAPDNEDSTIYDVNPAAFRGRSYRSLLDDMTEATQRFLVWVISQPSPSGALANFAAYLRRRRIENDGDDNRYWIGRKHNGDTYREIYRRDPDYVHWVQATARREMVSDDLWDFAVYTFYKDGVSPPERVVPQPSPGVVPTCVLGEVPDTLVLSGWETQPRGEPAESRTREGGGVGGSPQAGRGLMDELKMEQQAEAEEEEEQEGEEGEGHIKDETAASSAPSEGQATADMPGDQSYPRSMVKEEEEEETTGGSASRMDAALRAVGSGATRAGTQVKQEEEEEEEEEEEAGNQTTSKKRRASKVPSRPSKKGRVAS